MRYLIICLLFVSSQCVAQRYRLDSFGYQNGYDIYYPHALTTYNISRTSNELMFYASTNGRININGDTESYALMHILKDTVKILDSSSYPFAFPKQYRHSTKWINYYNKVDPVNGLELYNYLDVGQKPYKINLPDHDATNGIQGVLQTLKYENNVWVFKSLYGSNLTDIDTINFRGYAMDNKLHSYLTETILKGVNPNGHTDIFSYHLSRKLDTIPTNIHSITKIESIAGYVELYFTASDPQHGMELWTYEKHNKNHILSRLTDVAPGPDDGIAGEIYSNGYHYFCSPIDTINNSFNFYEYVRYNNTVKLLKTFYFDKNSPHASSPYCRDYISRDNKVYFTAPDGKDMILWEMRQYPYKDTPVKVIVAGIGSIKNTGAGTKYRYDSAHNLAIYFVGANDGLTKIYRLEDSSELNLIPLTVSPISITIYPNPTMQDAYMDVQLQQAQTMGVQVLDINGRAVYSQQAKLYSQGKHIIKLPIQQLPAGTYVYRVNDENGQHIYSGKLLKQ